MRPGIRLKFRKGRAGSKVVQRYAPSEAGKDYIKSGTVDESISGMIRFMLARNVAIKLVLNPAEFHLE